MLSEAAALEHYRPGATLRSLAAVLEPYVPPRLLERRWRDFMALNPRAERDLKMWERMRASKDIRAAPPRDGIEQRIRGLTGRRALIAETRAWARACHGIETRDPLDDVRLIDFCLSLPDDQFLRRGQTRWLARRVLRAAGAPPEISENRARGMWGADWFTRLEDRRPQLEREIGLLKQSSVASRLLDLDRLASLAARWPATAAEARSLRPQLDFMLNRALHVGAFIRWAETKGPGRCFQAQR
jgi:asparagine synthase (glutamine-hydrolysing)